MRREPDALALDFDSPEHVSEVYSDPLPTEDGDSEFEDHEDDDMIFMIGQELCEKSPHGSHIYRNGNNACSCCGAPAPWVHNGRDRG